MKPLRIMFTIVALAIVTLVAATAAIKDAQAGSAATRHALGEIKPAHAVLSTVSDSIIGAYIPGVPDSLATVNSFESLTDVNLGVVTYYSGWGELFKASFAAELDRRHIVPLVQIQPTTVSLAEIVNGSQDGYLVAYANAIRLYGRAVILSFGQKMNANWYSWGYEHASPTEFVAAWRYIVNLFRQEGADNVTWLWTVNSLTGAGKRAANPDQWWPGSKYVTWVGVDGYYSFPNETFTALFGPTIADIHKVTSLPILIPETGAAPRASKAAKVASLSRGVRNSKMLGFVWFDAKGAEDWSIDTPPAIAAFHAAANEVR
jgi:mannan endo-1,4-beta-mannosidase